MVPTLSKKEIKTQVKELRNRIGDSQGAVKGEFRHFRKAAKVFAKATGEYKKAKDAYDKKPKAKNERKLDAALDNFYQANDSYKEVYKLIESYVASMDQDYNELCDLLDMRGDVRKAEKATLEFEKYKEWLENKLSKMSKGVPELVEDEESDEEPVEELDENDLIFEEIPEDEVAPEVAPSEEAEILEVVEEAVEVLETEEETTETEE
jgi:hypothetical protein